MKAPAATDDRSRQYVGAPPPSRSASAGKRTPRHCRTPSPAGDTSNTLHDDGPAPQEPETLDASSPGDAGRAAADGGAGAMPANVITATA